jgi:hypothetical protein
MLVGTDDTGTGRLRRLDAELIGCQTPADILQATGRWMSARLADHGFEWRTTRRCLEAKTAGRSERIGFHGSRHNRTGRIVQVWTASMAVYDEGLGQWRHRNPAATVARPSSEISILCWSSYLDLSRKAITDLTDPGGRVTAAESLAVDLKAIALPWLAATRDAAALAGAVPDSLLRSAAICPIKRRR